MGNRTLYTYPVPESLQRELGEGTPKKLSFRKITVEEEKQATRRANNDVAQLAHELAFESFQGADGKLVSPAEGDRDTVWLAFDPKVRALCVSAYNKLHNPQNNEVRDFLAGEEVSIG